MTPLQAEVERVTRLAMAWPVYLARRTTRAGHRLGEGIAQEHLVCARCDQSVFLLTPDCSKGAYIVSTASINTGIAAHVRQSHTAD